MNEIVILEGGLRLCHKYMPHIRSVAMGVFVGTGARAETPQNNGISHFIEHMCFKGTKRRSAFEIVKEIDSLGAQINAFTSKEVTAFYTLSIDEYVEKCADILSDIFINHTFDSAELERERGVILEEIAMVEDMPDEVCQELASKAFWGRNSLGMPILGKADNIRQFTREDLFEYENKHYVSENIVVSFAGNITKKKAVELTKKYFTVRQGSADKSYLNSKHGNPKIIKRNKRTEQANVSIVYPSVKIEGRLEPALNILNSVMGTGMSSLLFQRIREQLGLAYSVYSYPSSYSDGSVFNIYMGTNHTTLKPALEALDDICKKLLSKGLTLEEFMRGKQQVKGTYILGQDSSLALMRAMGRYALSDNEYFDIEKRTAALEHVEPEDVRKLIDYIFEKKSAVGYVGRKLDFDIESIL